MFAAIVFYIGYSVYSAYADPLGTVQASYYTLEDAAVTNGYAVRGETVVYSEESVSISARSGEKVAVGSLLGVEYKTDDARAAADEIRTLKNEIAELESLIGSGGEISGDPALEAAKAVAYAVAAGETDTLDAAISAVGSQIFSDTGAYDGDAAKAELEGKKLRLSSLESSIGSGTWALRAEEGGIFVPFADGYEHVDADALINLAPDELEAMFKVPHGTDGAVGKIVTELTWYYAAVTDAEYADKLTVGKMASLRFERTYSAEIEMKVVSVGRPDAAGRCTVIFSTNRYLSDIAGVREMYAEVVFGSASGVRVPKEALHVDDGGTFVYIISGLQAKQVYTEIEADLGEHYLVSINREKGLVDGAEIITKGKNLFDGKVVG